MDCTAPNGHLCYENMEQPSDIEDVFGFGWDLFQNRYTPKASCRTRSFKPITYPGYLIVFKTSKQRNFLFVFLFSSLSFVKLTPGQQLRAVLPTVASKSWTETRGNANILVTLWATCRWTSPPRLVPDSQTLTPSYSSSHRKFRKELWHVVLKM